MGTILARKRKDGTTGFTAQIVKKQGGKIVHREAKTFNREREAKAWAAFRETELDKPGAIDHLRRDDPILADVIDRYVRESKDDFRRTKSQVLRSLKDFEIATMRCSTIRSEHVVALARTLAEGRHPSTVASYLSFLSVVAALARPAWGYPLDDRAVADGIVVAKKLGLAGRASERDRRPTLPELDKLLTHCAGRRPGSIPMDKIIAFAIFSTRRQAEITRLRWADLDEQHSRILVRDMKDPAGASGNHAYVDLPPEALRIIQSMPRATTEIFPFKADTISTSFRDYCALLQIEDLTFHDLRHEGVSRLFEMGRTIPQVASVSGHRSWQNLKRYAHLRQAGDKYLDWPWLARLAPENI